MPADRQPSSRVLVVEDNAGELVTLCDILESAGFEGVACSTAAEALRRMEESQFPAAIVDLKLPDMRGTELLERIRAIDEEVRVIIHTANASYDSAKEAINLGGFAYLEKGGDPREIIGTVHRACREWIDRYARNLERAVATRTEELARSNRELESFASVVAHDLRSPLLTISGFCQILKEEYSPSLAPEAGLYLDRVIDGVGRMSRLINDLLNYARLGRREEPRGDLELSTVIAQARANLAGPVAEAGAEIVVPALLPKVRGCPTQLVQLFQNLIGNAIKFRRSEPPRVSISAQCEDRFWKIQVADNGIGIAPEHFDKLFQVFHRLHREDEYPGTGIGLAICKKIVEYHGGQISLESEPGVGTKFVFTLPAADAETALPERGRGTYG